MVNVVDFVIIIYTVVSEPREFDQSSKSNATTFTKVTREGLYFVPVILYSPMFIFKTIFCWLLRFR